MAIPATPLAPDDEGYDALYAFWLDQGRPGALNKPAEGWAYRVYHPNASDPRPVFVLECSTPNLGVAFATYRLSWQGRGVLPIEDVNPPTE